MDLYANPRHFEFAFPLLLFFFFESSSVLAQDYVGNAYKMKIGAKWFREIRSNMGLNF